MPFTIIRNDIVKMHCDAIVNAANSSLLPGGGVCGAIFRAAGYEKLNEACRQIKHCNIGDAVITPGFDLPAKYVIHTVGPIWQGGHSGESDLLKKCYYSTLELARKTGCESVAFPLISSGIYGYPKDEALRIAVDSIKNYIFNYDINVFLVLFDRDSFILGEQKLGKLQRFIDERYVSKNRIHGRSSVDIRAKAKQKYEQQCYESVVCDMAQPLIMAPNKRRLEDLIQNMDESFSRMLLRMIDEKGMDDVEVYKRANIDRKLFSKLRKDGYQPSKSTVLALAISLKLNIDETIDFLKSAGYSFSHNNKSDIIIEYFITEKIYDIFEVNEALFAFDQKLLGANT